MKKIRLSDFLLTLAVAAMMLGYMSPSFAGKECVDGDTRPRCGGGDGGGGDDETTAMYTAELTAGDFVFGKLEHLTANNKGTGLPGNADLVMVPDPGNSGGWDYIFKNDINDCSSLVEGGVVTGFGVLEGNWSISYNRSKGLNKIHITMRDLVILPDTSGNYSQVQFDLDLHGKFAKNLPFLPESGSREFQLTQYKLWAGASGQGGFTCNSDGRPPLIPASTLVITRVE